MTDDTPFIALPDDWAEALPLLMAPEHDNLYLKVTGDEEVAFMADWRARRDAASEAAWEMSKSLGAEGFWPPMSFDKERVATMFAFAQKPENADKAWTFLKPRAKDTHFKAVPHKTSAAGIALRAKLDACLPFPKESEIAERIGAVHTLRYQVVDAGGAEVRKGMMTVGGPFQPTAHVNYAGDTYIVVAANPMKTLLAAKTSADWRSDPEEAKPLGHVFSALGPRYGHDAPLQRVQDWRPPEGYELISNAEQDLIFAQFRVEQEKLKAVAA